jgi:hypothetical protein
MDVLPDGQPLEELGNLGLLADYLLVGCWFVFLCPWDVSDEFLLGVGLGGLYVHFGV